MWCHGLQTYTDVHTKKRVRTGEKRRHKWQPQRMSQNFIAAATYSDDDKLRAATTAPSFEAGLSHILSAVPCKIETTANKARALTSMLAGCCAALWVLGGAPERLPKLLSSTCAHIMQRHQPDRRQSFVRVGVEYLNLLC